MPRYLSTVPNPDRKPWYVNLIYNKGMLKFDENGFYATLLDLDNRDKIKIDPREEQVTGGTPADTSTHSGSGLRIQVLDTDVSDEYERRVIEFLVNNSTPDPTNPSQQVFDTDTLNALANGITSPQVYHLRRPSRLRVSFRRWLSRWSLVPSASGGRYLRSSSRIIAGIFCLARRRHLALGGANRRIHVGAHRILHANVACSDGDSHLRPVCCGVLFPVFLMGRYRPGLYKEKLEWNAFREFLSDFSQMQRYGTEDLRCGEVGSYTARRWVWGTR